VVPKDMDAALVDKHALGFTQYTLVICCLDHGMDLSVLDFFIPTGVVLNLMVDPIDRANLP